MFNVTQEDRISNRDEMNQPLTSDDIYKPCYNSISFKEYLDFYFEFYKKKLNLVLAFLIKIK